MKKVLLDCGAHQGKGLNGMIKLNNIDTTWSIYSWEANPHAYADFLVKFRCSPLNITAFNSAVGNKDGTITVNIQQGNGPASGKGSSIVSLDEWRPVGTKPFIETAEIPMIDLSKWIEDHLEEDDYLVVKMDIEGSEYDVLEKIIERGVVSYIDKLYIEWHSSMFRDPEPYRLREAMIKEVFQTHKIAMEPW